MNKTKTIAGPGALPKILSRFLWLVNGILDKVHTRIAWISGWLMFVPRLDDIYIVTYPRSGTTWLQMILYQLTSSGTMDFRHISEVIPFLERAVTAGSTFDGLPSPRVFKTHLPYRHQRMWPGKYIYVARDGRDTLVSYFHFYQTHFGFKGEFSEFFDLFIKGRLLHGSWFKHVADWRAHASDPNVFFINYAELVNDFDGTVSKIASFCGLKISPELAKRVLDHSSFTFMKEHEEKFDHVNEVLWEHGLIGGRFLRRGKVGEWKELLSDEQHTKFQQAAASWHVEPVLSLDSRLTE